MRLLTTILLIFIITVPLCEREVENIPKLNIVVKKKADFMIAYQKLRRWEGNWCNTPGDFGLETYGGVTRRYNPEWVGWYWIDKVPNKKWNDSIPEVEFLVLDYYLTVWVREGFYKLENQDVANFLFDTRIHLHINSVKLLNKTYGYSLRYGPDWIDPVLDTIHIPSLQEQRKRFYLDLIKRKPHYNKFKRNWLRRADYV